MALAVSSKALVKESLELLSNPKLVSLTVPPSL